MRQGLLGLDPQTERVSTQPTMTSGAGVAQSAAISAGSERLVAVVTGAGSGIGRAIAHRLAEDGFAVASLDISEESAARTCAEIAKLGKGDASAWCSDVTREAEVGAALAEIRERFGPIHTIVNSAGVACAPGLPFTNNSEADWDRVLSVNLKGAFFAAKAASADMITAGDGRIVNVSSIVGVIHAPFIPPYSVSKAALNSLTKVMARDLAPHGVTVNAVCPGYVWTPMWDGVGGSMTGRPGGGEGRTPRAIFEDRVRTLVPMKREQTPEDVAALVSFLCSPAARNITGQIIAVDGGVTI